MPAKSVVVEANPAPAEPTKAAPVTEAVPAVPTPTALPPMSSLMIAQAIPAERVPPPSDPDSAPTNNIPSVAALTYEPVTETARTHAAGASAITAPPTGGAAAPAETSAKETGSAGIVATASDPGLKTGGRATEGYSSDEQIAKARKFLEENAAETDAAAEKDAHAAKALGPLDAKAAEAAIAALNPDAGVEAFRDALDAFVGGLGAGIDGGVIKRPVVDGILTKNVKRLRTSKTEMWKAIDAEARKASIAHQAAPTPTAPADPGSHSMAEAMVSRGEALLKDGDVVSARLLFEHAANAGYAPATAMGRTPAAGASAITTPRTGGAAAPAEISTKDTASAVTVATARPPAAPTPTAAADPGSHPMAEAMVNRGEALLKDGDVASARLLFERAANAGYARAATVMGTTFDAAFLTQVGVVGLRPDAAKAADWYRRAITLGDESARARLVGLPPSAGPAVAKPEVAKPEPRP